MLRENEIPRQTGFFTRFVSLLALVAVSAAFGSWYFFREQRINVLHDTEVLLWAEARNTLNTITLWYAPIKSYGKSVAGSDLMRNFVAEQTRLPSAEQEQIQRRLVAQKDAMRLQLRHITDRVDAAQAALVDSDGNTIVHGTPDGKQGAAGSADREPRRKAIAAALAERDVTVLPVRQDPGGPVLDVVFPIFGFPAEEEKLPCNGGLVLTFSLDDKLADWLDEDSASTHTTLILEQNGSDIAGLTEDGPVSMAWRQGQIVPGSTRGLTDGYLPKAALQGARAPAEFWRLARYTVPAGTGSPERRVEGVGVAVPAIRSWFIVKEIPAAQIEAQIESVYKTAIWGGCAAGALLFLLLILRWWWFDGRIHRQLRSAVDDSRYVLLRAITSALIDGICFTGVDGKIVYVNKAFADIFGKSPDEFAGKTFFDLFDARKAQEYAALDLAVLRDFTPLCFVDTLRDRRESADVVYQLHRIPVFSKENTLSGAVGILHRLDHHAGCRENQTSEGI